MRTRAPHLSDEAYDAALHTAEEDHPEVRGPAILGGFRALAEHPDARLIVAILSSRMLLIGACDVLFVLIAIEQFGTGESGAAILSAAIGAGGILGGMVAFGLIGRQRLAPCCSHRASPGASCSCCSACSRQRSSHPHCSSRAGSRSRSWTSPVGPPSNARCTTRSWPACSGSSRA